MDQNIYGLQEYTQFCWIGGLRDNLTRFGQEIYRGLMWHIPDSDIGRHSHAVNKAVS